MSDSKTQAFLRYQGRLEIVDGTTKERVAKIGSVRLDIHGAFFRHEISIDEWLALMEFTSRLLTGLRHFPDGPD